MPDLLKLKVKKVFWKDYSEKFKEVNPEFYASVEALHIEKNQDYYFYILKYHYGMNILSNGMLQLPTSAFKTVPLSDNVVPELLKKDLGYRSVPFGMILENGSEAYTEMDSRVISLSFFPAGSYLGLWEVFDSKESYFPKTVWDMSAGARNVFMLANIGESEAHEAIKKKFAVNKPAPKQTSDHWTVFREIAKHPEFSEKWTCTIAVFPEIWIAENKTIELQTFHYFLLQKAWRFSEYWRNLTTRDVVWELFVNYLTLKKLKPNPLFLDNLKHMLSISLGVTPAFIPQRTSNEAGPMKGFCSVYKDVYKLRYAPVVIVPHHYNDAQYDGPVYYIPRNPLFILSFPKYKNVISKLADLRALKELVDMFIEASLSEDLKLQGTPWQKILDNVAFDYFHDKKDAYGEIKTTQKMFKDDKRFYGQLSKDEKNLIPKTNFLTRSGCVRISKIYND